MDNPQSGITTVQIITWLFALLGYAIAFWQYRQKTNIEFRLKKYTEKRSLYEKYIIEFTKTNKATSEEEQLQWKKMFEIKHSMPSDEKEQMELEKSYIKGLLSSGFAITKLLADHSNALDILYTESSPEVLNYINQLKDEYSRLSSEINKKLIAVKKDPSQKEVTMIIGELSNEDNLETIKSLKAKMLDQMRIELKKY